MSKRTRTRAGHSSPTLDKRRRTRRLATRRLYRFFADILAWPEGLGSSATPCNIPLGAFSFGTVSSITITAELTPTE